MSGVFPLKSDEDTNPNILPGVIFEYGCKAYADRSGGYARETYVPATYGTSLDNLSLRAMVWGLRTV